MAEYAIGDVQGCYEPLMRLLDLIDFDENVDRLWFVGDLVNRGPESLAVLRFIKALPLAPKITLGNHDLHLLAALFANRPWRGRDDTLEEILNAADAQELGHWLRKQAILVHDERLNIVMTHAGIAPCWDLALAKTLALELESVLAGDEYQVFLAQMYGNEPHRWSNEYQGLDRLRLITNYFTRMRFCDEEGGLLLDYKGTVDQAPAGFYPWFLVPGRIKIEADLLFGHWAALMGKSSVSHLYPIDTGCYWGGELTALRLEDRKRFSVPGVLN